MKFDRADDTRESLEAIDDGCPSWKYIYDTLVSEKQEVVRTRKGKESITRIDVRGDYRQILEPYAGMPYPCSRVGTLTRVTRRYMCHWINFPRLTRDICRIPKIEKAMSESRQTRTGKIELVTDVACRIGTLSYTPEWAQVKASKQIDDILEPVTEITQDANNILAKTLEDKIVHHFRSGEKRRLRIMDIGTGSGNTIMPVMRIMENLARRRKIPKEYLNYIQIFLVDVSRHSLEKTFDRITSTSPMLRTLRQMTPVGNIVPITVNFADIEDNKILNHYKGKIDIVISGAAPCHQSDPLPFFRKMHSLLASEGILNIWDWYNGPSWAAPRLKLSNDSRRKAVYHITGPDGKERVETVNDGELYGLTRKELHDLLWDAADMNVVYEITEEDAGIVLANFQTLLGVLGYVGRESETGFYISRKIKKSGERIDRVLTRMFDYCMKNDRGPAYHQQGFSYLDDFLGKIIPQLDNPEPYNESAYYLIEGYGDDYGRLMTKAGFLAWNEPFMEVYQRHAGIASKEHTDELPAQQIRFTFGVKEDKENKEIDVRS